MGCDMPICRRGHRKYYDVECKYVLRLKILNANPTTCCVAAHQGQNILPTVTAKDYTFVTVNRRQRHPHRYAFIGSSLRLIPISIISCSKLGYAGWGVHFLLYCHSLRVA